MLYTAMEDWYQAFMEGLDQRSRVIDDPVRIHFPVLCGASTDKSDLHDESKRM